ncbi:MAG: hypothetical protein ACJZ85_00330 [Pontiellaceae bacterium]
MKNLLAKEVILIIIFGVLLIYFSLLQYEQTRPLSDHLPSTTQILYQGTPRDLFKSPLIHTLNQAFDADIEKTLQIKSWYEHIQDNDLIVAGLPQRTTGKERRWAVLVNFGKEIPWIRSRLNRFKSPSWKRLDNIAACPVWELISDNSNSSLRIALTENLLIACHSPYPDDIKIFIHFSHN